MFCTLKHIHMYYMYHSFIKSSFLQLSVAYTDYHSEHFDYDFDFCNWHYFRKKKTIVPWTSL